MSMSKTITSPISPRSMGLKCISSTFFFSQVIDSCKKLGKLMLYQNPGIRTVTGGAPRPNLLELDVSGCSLRASNLRTLAARCPNLENVDISGNKHLDGEGLQALVKGCSRLAILDIQVGQGHALNGISWLSRERRCARLSAAKLKEIDIAMKFMRIAF